MPQIFDNIEKHLLFALKDAMGLSERAIFALATLICVAGEKLIHLPKIGLAGMAIAAGSLSVCSNCHKSNYVRR